MASRFVGRDYSTLRSEIIEFLRQRLPNGWDYTNLSDPVVIFAESLARVGDQLHFTIDELRRECDVATANRASSVYSYAMREGYKMMLPKGSFGTISVNALPEQSDHIKLKVNKFDEIKVKSTGDSLYVTNDIDAILHAAPDEEYIESIRNFIDQDGNVDVVKRNSYASYAKELYNRTQHINVVLGKLDTFNFTYGDINTDSTVDLPNPIIDRDLVRLTVTEPTGAVTIWEYVDDIISSGFVGNIFTLTPKFIGGAITLCIEFPTSYRDLFTRSATFKFDYIKIENRQIENTEQNIDSIDLSDYITIVDGYEDDESLEEILPVISIGNGIRGYTEYEDASVTRANYKKFVQDYSALLTRDDYTSYIKVTTNSHCKVLDHSDNYRENVLPEGTNLLPRTLYILTDAPYSDRERLFYDLQERSSRSDCIVMIPYGKDPYNIIVKAECFLLGTSISEVSTKIKTALTKYYSDSFGDNVPTASMINYIVHQASDKVVRMDSLLVRDSGFGYINKDFSDVNTLSNNEIDNLFTAIKYQAYIEGAVEDEHVTSDVEKIGETYLKGTYEVTDDDGEVTATYYYNKYVPVTYNRFPDKFPTLYYIGATGLKSKVDTYEELIETQFVYGNTDSASWDIEDYDIFKTTLTDTVESKVTGTRTYLVKRYNNTGDQSTNNTTLLTSGTTSSGTSTDGGSTASSSEASQGTTTQSDSAQQTSNGSTQQSSESANEEVVTVTDEGKAEINDSETNNGSYYYEVVTEDIVTETPVTKCSRDIDSEYIEHHYMMPCLSKVIVLIKAVGN